MNRFLRTSSDLSKGRLQNTRSPEGTYLSTLPHPVLHACLYSLSASCQRSPPILCYLTNRLIDEIYTCRPFEDVFKLLACDPHLVLEIVGIIGADLSLRLRMLLHWLCGAVDEAGFDSTLDDIVAFFGTFLRRFFMSSFKEGKTLSAIFL